MSNVFSCNFSPFSDEPRYITKRERELQKMAEEACYHRNKKAELERQEELTQALLFADAMRTKINEECRYLSREVFF